MKITNDVTNFKALIIDKNELNHIKFKIGNAKIDNLKKGEVIIKVAYSGLNYKDILMLSGNPGLVRKYPHIPGIDASGTIYRSNSKKFKVGEKVFVVAQPCGVKSLGGLAQFLKIPSEWVTKLSSAISLKQTMVFGTAGFTAMLAVRRLLKNKIKRNSKPILITGATGGVGSIATLILSNLGFNTIALTRKNKSINLLKKIGANKVILLKDFLNVPNLPLLREEYSSIIDNVGGEIISIGSKQLLQAGKLISIGMTSASTTELSVYPLILRGVEIIGINAESTSTLTRKKTWKALEKIGKNKKMKLIYKECNFSSLIKVIKNCKKKNSVGRIVVKID